MPFYVWYDYKDFTGAHIFSVLVLKKGLTVTRVTLMDTTLYPQVNKDQEDAKYVNQLIFNVALKLLYLVDDINTLDSLMQVTDVVRSNKTDVPIDLQAMDEGFCQHWNTFFLYMVLVRNHTPRGIFKQVAALQPEERRDLIQDFSNELAQEAQLKPFVGDLGPSRAPIQSTARFVDISLPVVIE